MTMLACCSASARAMAFPMPLLPPVTMATLPARLISGSLAAAIESGTESCARRRADGGSGPGPCLHRRRVLLGEVRRRHDEPQVGERLGEVADQASGGRVVLLGQ